MAESAGQELAPRLREVEEEELLTLIGRHSERIGVPEARAALRNPFAGRRVVEALLEVESLRSSYEVRRQIAAHRQTPQPRAMALVRTLFWRDLVRLTVDARVPPRVRQAAESRLAERLPGFSAGEKIAIARQAGPRLIQLLRSDPSPRVVAGLLDNPRLTEALLLPLVASEMAAPSVLDIVARDSRWGVRYPVRVALCRNPRTPSSRSLELLSSIRKPDLKAVAADFRLAVAVRRRAELYLGRVS